MLLENEVKCDGKIVGLFGGFLLGDEEKRGWVDSTLESYRMLFRGRKSMFFSERGRYPRCGLWNGEIRPTLSSMSIRIHQIYAEIERISFHNVFSSIGIGCASEQQLYHDDSVRSP